MGRQNEKPKLLLVEGRDEEEFFAALLDHLGLHDIDVRAIQGKSRLSDRLKVLVKGPSISPIRSVGIVHDADNDPKAAFQHVCTALAAASLPVPERPEQMYGDTPQIGVLIVPDSVTPGMLEDLCLASVREDPTMTCVDSFFNCLGINPSFQTQNQAKARVRAFLAAMEWQEELLFRTLQNDFANAPLTERLGTASAAGLHAFLATRYKPDLRLGTAAQAGYWPLNAPPFAALVDFLRML